MPPRADHSAWSRRLKRGRILFANQFIRALVNTARKEGVPLHDAVVLATADASRLAFQEDPDDEHMRDFVGPFRKAFEAGEPWPSGFPPILVDRRGKIWDGHHRALAALEAGYRWIPVMRINASRKLEKILDRIGNSYGDLVDAVGMSNADIRRALRSDVDSIHWKG